MLQMPEAVRAYLLAQSAVNTLVTVISWGAKPAGQVNEWVILQRVGSAPLQDLQGETGSTKDRLQVTCFSLRGLSFASDIRSAIYGVIKGGERTFGDRVISAVWNAGAEMEGFATEVKAHYAKQDFYIHYDI